MPLSLIQVEGYLSNSNVKAFLDTIAWAEGGRYNNIFGGSTFSDYSRHPNRRVTAGGYTSTAAGRYQFLYSTWNGISNILGLRDFSPHSQDLAAVYLIYQRGQLAKIASGDLIGTLKGLGCAWAALPYATCNQKTRGLQETVNFYNNVAGKGSVSIPLSNGNVVLASNNIPVNVGLENKDVMILAAGAGLILILALR